MMAMKDIAIQTIHSWKSKRANKFHINLHESLQVTTDHLFTVLQAGRSRVRFPIMSLEFFIDIILLPAVWPWG
jgi:hypothetical protein